MRLIKLVGLAVIAALASMAFIGASSASAETLCEENVGHTKECPEKKRVLAGKFLHAEALEKAVLLSSIGDVKCNSLALAEVVRTGNHEPVLVLIHDLTFTNCEGACEKAKSHTLPFHLEVYADDTEFKLDIFAQIHPKDEAKLLPGGLLEGCSFFKVNCLYQVKSDLALVGEVLEDELDFLVELERSSHSGLCPATSVWHAKYLITLDTLEPTKPAVYLALLP